MQETLRKGQSHVIPFNAIAPIMVFVHEGGARVRFRGEVRRLQGDRAYTYGKLNTAEEKLAVLDGVVELSYSDNGTVRRVVQVGR